MTFVAPTREEAYKLAQEYMKTVDPYRQPYISINYENAFGEYIVVVKERGLD